MSVLFGSSFLILTIALYVVGCIPLYAISARQGSDFPAWFAFVPVLNVLLLVDCAGLEWWYAILFLLPVAGTVLYIYCWWQIADGLGHEGWVSLFILIPIIGMLTPFYIAFASPA